MWLVPRWYIVLLGLTLLLWGSTTITAVWVAAPVLSYRFDVPTEVCDKGWFDSSGYAGTGAIVLGSSTTTKTNCKLSALTLQPTFSVRLVFALKEASSTTSIILDICNEKEASFSEPREIMDNIQLGLEGYAKNAIPTPPESKSTFVGRASREKSLHENNMFFRVHNGKVKISPGSSDTVKASCELIGSAGSNGSGCTADSPGFFRPGVWYDLILTMNSTGHTSVYSNGSLVAQSAPFRHRANQPYSVFIGSSTRLADSAFISVRAIDIYNVSLSPITINRIYTADGNDVDAADEAASGSQNGLEGADDGAVYANYEQTGQWTQNQLYTYGTISKMSVIPNRRDSSLQRPLTATELFYSFHDRSSFEVDGRVASIPDVYLNGSASFQLDAASTPSVNAIVLKDSQSFITIAKPVVLAGPLSIRMSFKWNTQQQQQKANPVLFACSAINAVGTEIDRISLHIDSSSSTPKSPRLVYTMLRGDHHKYSMNASLFLPTSYGDPSRDLSFGWHDVLLVVHASGVTELYNYGTLMGSAQLALPYPTVRDRCYLGRNTHIPINNDIANQNLCINNPVPTPRRDRSGNVVRDWEGNILYDFVCPPFYNFSAAAPVFSNFRGAIGLFNYVPYAVSASTIRAMVPYNNTVNLATPFNHNWFLYDWIYNKPLDVDPLMSSDAASATPRYGAISTGYSLQLNNTIGSYANLGLLLFCAETTGLTIQFKFRLEGTLQQLQGATLLDMGNGITTPYDNLILKVGQVNERTADLVLQVWRAGTTCRTRQAIVNNPSDCFLIVPGALHVDVDINLVLVFSNPNPFNSTIRLYIDGRELASTTELWSPSSVERPYSYIGYSHSTQRSTNMQVYSLTLSPKSFNLVDVLAVSPYPAHTYTNMWLNSTSTDPAAASAEALGVGSDSTSADIDVEGDGSVVYPVYHPADRSLFSINPFGQDTWNKDAVDGTQADRAFRRPTPGLKFNNEHSSDLINEETSKRNLRQLNVDEQERIHNWLTNQTIFKQDIFNNLNNVTSQKKQLGIQITVQKNNIQVHQSTWNETIKDEELGKLHELELNLQQLEFQFDWLSGNLSRINSEQANTQRSDYESRLHTLEKELQTIDQELSNLAQRKAGSDQHSYVQLQPMHIGGVFTLRVKCRVKQDVPITTPAIILDISNGSRYDNIVVSLTGATAAQVVNITICRGSLCQTALSAPMNGSFYWLDMIFTLNDKHQLSMYNWGKRISTIPKTLWLPVPGLRSEVYLARNVENTLYLKESAIAVFQWLPYVQTSSAISSIYTYDKPPVTLSTLVGPWYVQRTDQLTSLVWIPSEVETLFRTCQQCWALPSMICPWDQCQVKGDKNEVSQRRAKLLADAVAKSKDSTWKLYQFPSLSRGNNETELQRDVLDALSRTAKLKWMFNNGVKEATVWTYGGQVSDWAYFNEEFENVVEQPYLHYGNVMKKFLTPENMFSDKEYGTVDHTTHITHILYYEPQLLVYDNRAPVRSPLRPSGFSLGDLFGPIAKPLEWIGEKTGITRLLGGDGDGDGGSGGGALPQIDPDLYVMQFEDLSKPENNVTFRQLASNNKILFVIPPTIMFQYSGKTLNSESVPKPYMRSAVGLDDNTNLLFHGSRLKDDYRGNKTIKSFTLSPQERIIQVNSVCNYRFEFVTNMGRTLIVGDYDMLAQANQCQGILQMTDVYNGNDTPLPSQQSPFPKQLLPSDVKQDKVWNPLQQSEGPPGYCLQYMEGSKGGMWAYRWHWVKAPSAYTMYNMVFQYEAANAMAGSQPTQAIAIDLYNHSPLVQSVSASHTLSLTSSSSFTNIDTTETNWNIGVSMSIEMNEQVGAMGEVTALTTVGFSAGLSSSIGGSQSHSTEYGKSVSDEVSDTQTLTATVPPSSKVTATLLVFSGTVDIPYTADVKIDYYSGESEHIVTRGIFTNVKTTSIMVTYSDAQPIEFSPAALGM